MINYTTEFEIDKDGYRNYYIRIETSSVRDFNALRKLIDEYWFGKKDPEDCKCVLGELVERNSNTQNKWCCENHKEIEEDKNENT